VQTRIEQHVAPEIAKARDTALRAMQEAEQGRQRAIEAVAQRAGLAKGPEGAWSTAA
jgi:hypothetical protein